MMLKLRRKKTRLVIGFFLLSGPELVTLAGMEQPLSNDLILRSSIAECNFC